jgi:hypothetical protein
MFRLGRKEKQAGPKKKNSLKILQKMFPLTSAGLHSSQLTNLGLAGLAFLLIDEPWPCQTGIPPE